MRELRIGGKVVNDFSDCYVIAEIGHNHQGDLGIAAKMIEAAAECGADAVKFQKRDNANLFTESGFNKPYENENSFGKTYGEHRQFLEFGFDEYSHLMDVAYECGVDFFATAFDFASADFLNELGVPCFKVASGDLKNTPLLRHIARFGKPVIMSTGGADGVDVNRAYCEVVRYNSDVCLMQCTAAYPADFGDLNLRVIETYTNAYDCVVGLSSHDNGIAMAVAAYVLGARVIEKHFTLNHTMKGTDHAFSLEPIGFKKMVRDLRRTKLALGDGCKYVYESEREPILKMGKRLVYAKDLPAGHVLVGTDIAIKSPGGGVEPYLFYDLMGQTVPCDVSKDDDVHVMA